MDADDVSALHKRIWKLPEVVQWRAELQKTLPSLIRKLELQAATGNPTAVEAVQFFRTLYLQGDERDLF